MNFRSTAKAHWRLAVNLSLAVIGVALSVFVGIHFKSVWPGLVSAVVWTILQIVADIRLSIEGPEKDSLLALYGRLRSEPCELFSRAAEQKYAETLDFLQTASSGKLEVHSKTDVHEILSFILKELRGLKEITATSQGELGEWSEPDSWWMRKYVKDHQAAIERGIVLRRIYIVNSEEELASGRKAFEINRKIGVDIKAALAKQIEPGDLIDGGNCMLFWTEKKRPLYVLKASHDKDGEFIKAEIFRDDSHTQHFLDLYSRIANVSFPINERHATWR